MISVQPTEIFWSSALNPFDTFDTPLCAVCGQRPGAVQVVGPGGRAGAVCESCAQRLMAQRSGGRPVETAREPREPQSKTPALDEFGRDLTEEAREGRIDPVIGRDDE